MASILNGGTYESPREAKLKSIYEYGSVVDAKYRERKRSLSLGDTGKTLTIICSEMSGGDDEYELKASWKPSFRH